MEKVLNITFSTEKETFKAARDLKALHNANDLELAEMYVISKNNQGKISLKTGTGSDFKYTAGFGLIGSLAGFLIGPQGILFGAGYGMLLGMVGDLMDLEDSERYLKAIAADIPNNSTMLVAHVWEDWKAPLDTVLEPYQCTVKRIVVADELNKEFDAFEAELNQEIEDAQNNFNQQVGEEKAKAKSKLEKLKADKDERMSAFQAETRKNSEELKELLVKEKSIIAKTAKKYKAKLKSLVSDSNNLEVA